ncbi:metal-dependent hydrolase [Romboutsia sp. 1001216sp1]|uniref:metal-dependent hydrolase n=1 Tax=unclassified Romboutsia TaxID=2626894 RepID=UPI0018AAAF0B|nr:MULTISPECIES: metal-dependent hydrolase [unclassified Romboutsia]MDB8792997.1 metal-dependent hydrolase [Romboutsia sp. 1001216sp1]MDB8795200.1 metal-dependent hydrolase [Romboutsia sp. 1001216sp1]MDB8799009.1 metal-dependent hydrolase [Romboutsia sp. 1001216sp1]
MRGKTHCTIGVLSVIQASLLFNIPISIFNIILSAFFSILPDLDESNSIVSEMFLKKNTSKFILKITIYLINVFIFFISLKINDNFFLSSLITFISIFIIESKLNHTFLRKVFISLIFILLGFCLYLVNIKIYFSIFCFMLATFPWLKHRSFSHSIFAIIIVYFLLKQIELITNILNLSFFGTISYASHIFLGDLFTRSGIPLLYPISDKKFSLGFFKVGGFLNNTIEIIFIMILTTLVVFTIINKFNLLNLSMLWPF